MKTERHKLLQMLVEEFGAGFYVIKSGQMSDWPGLTLSEGQLSGSSVTIGFCDDTTLTVGFFNDRTNETKIIRLDLNHAESINIIETLIIGTLIKPFADLE